MMHNISLRQLADSLHISLPARDCAFSSLSIDSRKITQGDVFVAIKGENFDGHHYLKQAEQKGASALVLSQYSDINLPCLQVIDTRIALGHISALWRQNFNLPVVAITGSCGKTSVKEMTTAIFHQAKGKVLSTKGNFNNDIGVPLTLMRLNEQHKMAVIEIGANHQAEIDQLVHYVQPDVALITNVTHAHIEGFGSIDGIARAKAEIYNGLAENGMAIINADDHYAPFWNDYCAQQGKNKLLTFAIDHQADIKGEYVPLENGIKLKIQTPIGEVEVRLKQYGKHNVYNALAATALAVATGCQLTDIHFGLENFTPVSARLEQKKGVAESIIFDDSYNANPGSVRAGIDAIKSINGTYILVLGDMAELGGDSEKLHYQLGQHIASSGIKQLFTLGKKSQQCVQGFNDSSADNNALNFAEQHKLIEQLNHYLQDNIEKNNIVLIKGSRGMKMENVVKALLDDKHTPVPAENSPLNNTMIKDGQ